MEDEKEWENEERNSKNEFWGDEKCEKRIKVTLQYGGAKGSKGVKVCKGVKVHACFSNIRICNMSLSSEECPACWDI